jgi:hypothetical protein
MKSEYNNEHLNSQHNNNNEEIPIDHHINSQDYVENPEKLI